MIAPLSSLILFAKRSLEQSSEIRSVNSSCPIIIEYSSHPLYNIYISLKDATKRGTVLHTTSSTSSFSFMLWDHVQNGSKPTGRKTTTGHMKSNPLAPQSCVFGIKFPDPRFSNPEPQAITTVNFPCLGGDLNYLPLDQVDQRSTLPPWKLTKLSCASSISVKLGACEANKNIVETAGTAHFKRNIFARDMNVYLFDSICLTGCNLFSLHVFCFNLLTSIVSASASHLSLWIVYRQNVISCNYILRVT